MYLNRVELIGRVTKQPELKNLPSGSAVTSFGVATNHSYKNKAGEKVETVAFHNCTLFGKGAEIFAKYVTKGQEVYVAGRIEYRQWEKKDGTKVNATDILVEDFQFGQKPKGEFSQVHPAESAQEFPQGEVEEVRIDEDAF